MSAPHDTGRRRLLAASGLAAIGSSVGAQPAGDGSPFSRGGLKGFVLGTVQRDPSLLDAATGFGARLMRVFFPFRRCQGCSTFGRAADDVDALWALLGRAQRLGLRLVVVGGFEGVEAPGFWSDAELHDSVVDNWRWFAREFGTHPALAGMDLLNEPNPPWPSGNIAQAQAVWHPLAQRAIDAIREQGVGTTIVFEGVAGGSVWGLRGLSPFKDANTVYSIHFYTPHDITHQGVNAAWPRRIPYPAGVEFGLGAWDARYGVTAQDASRMELELADARRFEQRHGVPIYVGEFSCVRWAPRGGALRWLGDCLALFDEYGWSWTYHEFRGWPGWDAEIDSEDPRATLRSAHAPRMRLLSESMRRRA
jgi:endoglucanase